MEVTIHIIKHQRLMMIKSGNEIIKSYQIALGKNPFGKKEFEGDHKTPEGEYTINDKSTTSKFYKNLGISYPNDTDLKQANALGKNPGGLIKIHGFPNEFNGDQELGKKTDWTEGCIAVTNTEMDEIYEIVSIGSKIIIDP